MSAAKICRALLDRGNNALAEGVYDLAGVTERTGDAIVGQLCGQGVLERLHDRLRIKNIDRARMIAADVPSIPDKVAHLATTSGVMDPLKPTPVARAPFIVTPGLKPRDDVMPESRFRPIERPFLFDYAALKLGQCFMIEDVPAGWTAKDAAYQVRQDADRFVKRNEGFHFAVRAFEERGKMKIGIWRNEKQGKGAHLRTTPQARHDAKTKGNGKAAIKK